MQALRLVSPSEAPAAGARARLRLALPKGRMQAGVLALLAEAGVGVATSERSYRPRVSLAGVDVKLLKPQSIVEMLALGSRDVGFAGADWVAELCDDGQLVELVDTELDPVRLVAAAPEELLADGALPARRLVVASEYQRLASRWIEARAIEAVLLRSYGATEVFPPEDADCIVDNTATGSTLRDNGLVVVDELMRSSTRLYASARALEGERRATIEELVLLVRSVLEARKRVMVEVNVSAAALEAILEVLPCMRKPTVAPLSGDAGFAVKAAVPRADLPRLVVELKARGGTDVVVTKLSQIIA
jgi:ATP phosphoribosyltransferase